MLKITVLFCLVAFVVASPLGLVQLSRKYFMYPTAATFLQALTFCEYYNMKVPIVTTKETNDELYELFEASDMPKNFFWIRGLYQRNAMHKGWTWVTSNEAFNFTDWRFDGTPNFSGDNCIKYGYYEKKSPGLWAVGPCESAVADILCEVPY